MKILLVGGGSGGHVTPLKAIVKQLQIDVMTSPQVTVITDRRFFKQSQQIFSDVDGVKLKKIFAGKFRRYNSKSLLWHLTHVPTLLKNLGDSLLLAIGIVQSLLQCVANRPDVIFCKGGYVCIPIGIAAHICHIPLVIHDSDTHPGLTNRILARWAKTIATGMPAKYYEYPDTKMVYTGIPVAAEFAPISTSAQTGYKQQLGLSEKRPLLLTTGGGTGAVRLNQAVLVTAQSLIEEGWQIVQLTGTGKDQDVLTFQEKLSPEVVKHWQVFEFVEMVPYILAADIIVSRTGASAMQEFANAQKPVITIPSRFLTGGHQLKNAKMFQENEAVIVLDEEELATQPELLKTTVTKLHSDTTRLRDLAHNLHQTFAKPDAASQLATLILKAAR